MESKHMHPSSSKAFQKHQEHDLKKHLKVQWISYLQNKLPDKSFNIQELLHRNMSEHHETKLMHPSSRAFQRDQECDLKHLGLVDLIGTKTKQKKQTTLLHR
jgi:hypothetical protein